MFVGTLVFVGRVAEGVFVGELVRVALAVGVDVMYFGSYKFVSGSSSGPPVSMSGVSVAVPVGVDVAV